METAGQHMQQESAHELLGRQRHGLMARAPLGPVVLPFKTHPALIHRKKPTVGDSHPVRIARQVGQHRLGASKRPLGVDHPLALAHRCQPLVEEGTISQRRQFAEEPQPPRLVQAQQLFDEAPSHQPGQHAHRQKEARSASHPGLAVRSQSTAWHDAMYMRVMRQCRTPGMQHQRGTDACTQMLAVSSDGLQHLGGDIKQQPIEFYLVLVRQICNGRGQREDHVVILHGQQISLAGIEPALGCSALALGAVSVAAGVVGDQLGGAAIAAQHMSPQCRCAALLNGRHDLELRQAQVTALAVTPGGTMLEEDVGDLQSGPLHARTFRRQAWAPRGRSPRAAGQSPRGRRSMWSPASCAPAAPESRGYRPCAPADAWQSCGAGCG